jgi:chemotaxis signal transduction protein
VVTLVDVVLFELGNRRCAVELATVEEVIPLGPITPVPSAPPAIAGAVNVRGQVCPVLRLELVAGGTLPDKAAGPRSSRPSGTLRDKAAGPPPRQGDPCLLVRAAGSVAVLHVGRIREVVRIGGGQLLSSGGTSVVVAVLDTPHGTLQLIDTEQVIRQVAREVHELWPSRSGSGAPGPGSIS